MLLRQLFSRRIITSDRPQVLTHRTTGTAIESLESRTLMSVASPIIDDLIGNTAGVPAMVNKLAKPAKGTDAALGQVLNVSIPGVTSLTRGA